MGFDLTRRVYYDDTDAGGVVYHTNYLRFMEHARTEWLRTLGFEQDVLMHDPGVIFTVRRIEFEYLQPARFNDLLRIHTELSELRKASLGMRQRVFRAADDQLLGEGAVRLACIDSRTMRPTAIPQAIIERIRGAE
jgi:acyl-CoA thioester hydrolase